MVVLPNAQTIGCVYLQPPFGRLGGVDGSCLMRARVVGAFCAPASSVLSAAWALDTRARERAPLPQLFFWEIGYIFEGVFHQMQ